MKIDPPDDRLGALAESADCEKQSPEVYVVERAQSNWKITRRGFLALLGGIGAVTAGCSGGGGGGDGWVCTCDLQWSCNFAPDYCPCVCIYGAGDVSK